MVVGTHLDSEEHSSLSLRTNACVFACNMTSAMRELLAWGLVCSMLIHVGCALAPVPSTSFDSRVVGKLSLTRGEERTSLNFSLTILQERQEWEFWGPLGRGHTQATYGNGKLEVHAASGDSTNGDELQGLIDSTLGNDFPLGVFASWIRFRPDPSDEPFERLGESDDRIDAFEQLGWLVELKQVVSTKPSEAPLPARLVLSRDDFRLVVVIRTWEVGR